MKGNKENIKTDADSPKGKIFFPYGKRTPELLIIEDNPDVVVYLKSCLQNSYQLDVAYNGKIGIEKALENIPDLIIIAQKNKNFNTNNNFMVL